MYFKAQCDNYANVIRIHEYSMQIKVSRTTQITILKTMVWF